MTEDLSLEIILRMDFKEFRSLDSGLERAKQILKDAEPNTQTLHYLGIANYRLVLHGSEDSRLLEDAIHVLSMAKEQGADEKELYYDLGCAYYLIGDSQEAISNLLAAISLSPKNYLAIGMLARCYSDMGKHHQAIEFYEDAVDLAKQAQDYAALESYYLSLCRLNKSIGDGMKAGQYQAMAEEAARTAGSRIQKT